MDLTCCCCTRNLFLNVLKIGQQCEEMCQNAENVNSRGLNTARCWADCEELLNCALVEVLTQTLLNLEAYCGN